MINFKPSIIFLFLPLVLIGIYSFIGVPQNFFFLITNLLIIIFSFLGIFNNHLLFYSLFKIFFIFNFVFFGIHPLINEVNKVVIFGDEFNIYDKVKANLIILLGISLFSVGGCLKVNFFDRFTNRLPDIYRVNFFYFIIFFFIAFLILNRWNFDLNSLFLRGRDPSLNIEGVFDSVLSLDTNVSSKFEYHFYMKFIRPMPIILLVIFFYYFNKNKNFCNTKQKLSNIILLFFLTLSSVFLVFPTGLDRLQAAHLYIPLVIIFTKIWEKSYVMQTSLLAGIFIVFPFLDKFRHFSNFEDFTFKINPFSFLQTAHFDAYESFVRTIELDIITYGNQLLSAVLFFVPRFIWQEKSIGSGSFLAIEAGYDFHAGALPFIGEGYINFGTIGSSLFMFLLGIILSNLDRIAWKTKKLNKDSLFLYYYYFLFGLLIFLLRGDLINSIAFITFFTFSFWILVVILKFTSRLKI
jgi:hypothetical protein